MRLCLDSQKAFAKDVLNEHICRKQVKNPLSKFLKTDSVLVSEPNFNSHQKYVVRCMEGFGFTEVDRRRRSEVKARALGACAEQLRSLKRCYRESWLGWCAAEHDDFWECFQRVRLCVCACVASEPCTSALMGHSC